MFTKEMKESARSLNNTPAFLRFKAYLEDELSIAQKALMSAKDIEIIYRLQGTTQWLSRLLIDLETK